jgi:WD40 repeat protein
MPAHEERLKPSPEPVAVLRGHASDVQALAYLPGRCGQLLVGDAEGTLKLWDTALRRALFSMR